MFFQLLKFLDNSNCEIYAEKLDYQIKNPKLNDHQSTISSENQSSDDKIL